MCTLNNNTQTLVCPHVQYGNVVNKLKHLSLSVFVYFCRNFIIRANHNSEYFFIPMHLGKAV